MTRHVARIAVDPRSLALARPGFTIEVIGTDLPPDARCVNAAYDPMFNCFWVLVEHESFALVKDGEIVPVIHGPTFRITGP